MAVRAAVCALAAQNGMLTAKSLGFGTCRIGFAQMYLNTTEAKERLNAPAEYTVIAPLVIGYPKGDGPAVPGRDPEVLFYR